jgi:ATP/ADP translocase
MIAAGGSGFVLNTLLPACQAPLEEKDQAAITAAWSFMRSFGSIWGVAIPSAIFNNRFSQLLGRIQDPQVAAMFINGAAYQHATAAFLNSFSEPTKDQLIGVYTDSLKRVWEIAIVFSGVAFLLVFIEKEIKLRTELDTDFGLETENTADVDTVEKKTLEVDQANRLEDSEL